VIRFSGTPLDCVSSSSLLSRTCTKRSPLHSTPGEGGLRCKRLIASVDINLRLARGSGTIQKNGKAAEQSDPSDFICIPLANWCRVPKVSASAKEFAA
jgi:hypothetical protein